MNVRSVSEHIRKRKNKVAPHTTIDGEWLKNLVAIFR